MHSLHDIILQNGIVCLSFKTTMDCNWSDSRRVKCCRAYWTYWTLSAMKIGKQKKGSCFIYEQCGKKNLSYWPPMALPIVVTLVYRDGNFALMTCVWLNILVVLSYPLIPLILKVPNHVQEIFWLCTVGSNNHCLSLELEYWWCHKTRHYRDV